MRTSSAWFNQIYNQAKSKRIKFIYSTFLSKSRLLSVFFLFRSKLARLIKSYKLTPGKYPFWVDSSLFSAKPE